MGTDNVFLVRLWVTNFMSRPILNEEEMRLYKKFTRNFSADKNLVYLIKQKHWFCIYIRIGPRPETGTS